ncbi:MAG TPA: hypothetical protein VN999_15320 [Thermoanaerobaculia bacterium]|nr:hypothetical protein [Thermoanaerobaculia bacterium]
MEPIGPSYRPPALPGTGWTLVAAGGFRLVPGERYQLAVRSNQLTGEPDYISAVCDGPRAFRPSAGR